MLADILHIVHTGAECSNESYTLIPKHKLQLVRKKSRYGDHAERQVDSLLQHGCSRELCPAPCTSRDSVQGARRVSGGLCGLVGAGVLLQGLHGVLNLPALLREVGVDGRAQAGVPDVVRAVRHAGHVAALELVLALCASLNSGQTPLYGSFQRLHIAEQSTALRICKILALCADFQMIRLAPYRSPCSVPMHQASCPHMAMFGTIQI